MLKSHKLSSKRVSQINKNLTSLNVCLKGWTARVQLAKCLLCKHDDQTLDPQHFFKNLQCNLDAIRC